MTDYSVVPVGFIISCFEDWHVRVVNEPQLAHLRLAAGSLLLGGSDPVIQDRI